MLKKIIACILSSLVIYSIYFSVTVNDRVTTIMTHFQDSINSIYNYKQLLITQALTINNSLEALEEDAASESNRANPDSYKKTTY